MTDRKGAVRKSASAVHGWWRAFGFAGKCLLGVVVMSPLIYAVLLSFMTPAEIAAYPPKLWPNSFDLRNYVSVLNQIPLWTFLKNSVVVSVIVIVAQVIIASLAAYAFAFFEFRGKRFIFFLVLATIMFPGETIIIGNYLTIANMGLTDTYIALVLPYLVSGMGIFMMRQFYMTIPKELKEAAEIDGCGDMRFFVQIALPISMPAVAALGFYVFVLTYNQFMWPLLVTNRMSMRTVQVGMSMLMESETPNYGMVLAGAVFMLIPAVVVFIIGQRYLVKGMTEGAVKG